MKSLTIIRLQLAIIIYTGVCWIINLIQFINCDFASPYKDEVIKGIGVFTFWASGVTVWF